MGFEGGPRVAQVANRGFVEQVPGLKPASGLRNLGWASCCSLPVARCIAFAPIMLACWAAARSWSNV
eukprot:6663608-Pyramimonas_sp.AAC.1